MNTTILLILIVSIAIILLIVMFIPSKKTGNTSSNKPREIFELKAGRKTIKFFNPYIGFLVYGGAGSGKTKSIAKPLLEQYIKHGFAGFIYDYKDFDLTQTARHLCLKHNYQHKFYSISFTDMNMTYRTNPIAPHVVKDENIFLQLLDDLFLAYIHGTQNEWTDGAKGVLQGVGYRFFEEIPQYCTIPHIAIFICTAGAENLTTFLEGNVRSRGLASAFLDSKRSPKTQASYLSSLTNVLSKLSFNKNVAYVLSGNDFDFNLIDPESPKLVSVANSFQIESLISPIISLMLSISSRQFTMKNKIPFFYMLDEATTFKITDFQKYPSVLREYKCSITLLTQSASKIEQLYGKQAKASIESNFGNQFYGRTLDTLAIQAYPLVFGKREQERISKSKGSTASGNSASTTISQSKELIYDSNVFTELLAGEFIGRATDANMKTFKLRFNIYQDKEESITSENNESNKVDLVYSQIQENVKEIIQLLQ